MKIPALARSSGVSQAALGARQSIVQRCPSTELLAWDPIRDLGWSDRGSGYGSLPISATSGAAAFYPKYFSEDTGVPFVPAGTWRTRVRTP